MLMVPPSGVSSPPVSLAEAPLSEDWEAPPELVSDSPPPEHAVMGTAISAAQSAAEMSFFHTCFFTLVSS